MNELPSLLYAAVLGAVDGLTGLDIKGWKTLLGHAHQEQLDGLLYLQCAAADTDMPEEIRARLRGRYWRTAEDNVVALQELGDVLERLAENGFEVLLMPGAALLPLYPDPGCRPMDDIDILVKPGELPEVRTALQAQGFLSPPRYEDLFSRGRVVLDLHADLLNCSRISARRHAGWMEVGEIWQGGRSTVVEGGPGYHVP